VRSITFAALSLLSIAAPVAAQTVDDDPPSLFGKQDAVLLGVFTIGTIAAQPLDRLAAHRLQDSTTQANRFLLRQSRNLELISTPGSFIIGGTLYAIGKLADNERMADLGLHGTEAVFVATLANGVIKGLAGRARPYVDPDNSADFSLGRGFLNEEFRSFPSGHTTAAFAAAAAVTEETRRWWPKYTWLIGTAMYGGAALGGVSRMYNNYHWASDVIMGAAIGTLAGLKVPKYHHRVNPDNAWDRALLGISISPRPSGDGRIVRLVLSP
jgi:membrane-associated phospholipid phosphatase